MAAEQPVVGRWRPRGLIGVLAAIVLVLSAGAAPVAGGMARPAGPAGSLDVLRPPTGRYIPRLADAAGDVTALHLAGCQQRLTGSALIRCIRGDPEGSRRALLVGASHATHWYPALNRIARDRHWRLVTAVKAGCLLSLDQSFSSSARDQSCRTWIERVVRFIRRNPPDVIITTGTVTTARGERIPAGYLDMWRLFDRLGIPVVAIRDTPRAAFDRVDCLLANRNRPGRCSVARAPTLDTDNPLELVSLPRNVIVADLSAELCSADRCPAVSGSHVIYRDGHHLTATFARGLAGALGAQIPGNPNEAVYGPGEPGQAPGPR